MARANRHFIPGYVWHLTHRCHKREFLFKFAKDRLRWMQWLYEAKKRYSLVVLDYIVTSNHTHLLVYDNGSMDVIPKSVQLLAGRIGQEYNIRKKRNGAFWQDRYHATAVETGEHFRKCIVYIDLNMVRAGVITHPSQWYWSGYNEIQKPRRKNVLIDYDKVSELAGFTTFDTFQSAHRTWVDSELEVDNNKRKQRWTESLAVGGNKFINDIMSHLGPRANGRKIIEKGQTLQIREEVLPYNHHFEGKNSNIASKNTLVWQQDAYG